MKRRDLLKSLPAVTLASPILISASAAAAPTQSAPPSTTQATFEVALKRYDEALAEKNAAVSRFNALAPRRITALDAISHRQLANGYRSIDYIAERDQDAEGNDIWVNNRPRYSARSWCIFDELGHIDGRTKEARHLKFLRAMAQQYEADLDRARVSCGIEAAIKNVHFAEADLSRALHGLCREPALSPSTVLAKVNARLAAVGRVPSMINTHLDQGLMEDIATVLGGLQ